jgi:hypothetical protein
MARKKTTKRAKKKSARTKKTRTPINWEIMRTWAFPVLACASIVALGAGMTIGADSLDDASRNLIASQPPTIELASPTDSDGNTWVREEDRQILENRVRTILDGSDPFDRRPLAAIGMMLETTGWFRSVPRVERVGQRTIRITGDWRRPAAVVRSDHRDHLISWQGFPMPVVFAPGGSEAPIILGSGIAPSYPNPADRYARVWPGEDVAAALDILRLVAFKPYRKQVAAIDISKVMRSGTITLITDQENRIVWGGRPGEFHAGEVSDEEKLARLDAFFERIGRIDGGFDRVEIQGPVILHGRSDPEP